MGTQPTIYYSSLDYAPTSTLLYSIKPLMLKGCKSWLDLGYCADPLLFSFFTCIDFILLRTGIPGFHCILLGPHLTVAVVTRKTVVSLSTMCVCRLQYLLLAPIFSVLKGELFWTNGFIFLADGRFVNTNCAFVHVTVVFSCGLSANCSR